MVNYIWLHFKRCSHGDPWPCTDQHSCGEDGWTIGVKNDDSVYHPYQVVGSDEIFTANEFDQIVPLKEQHP